MALTKKQGTNVATKPDSDKSSFLNSVLGNTDKDELDNSTNKTSKALAQQTHAPKNPDLSDKIASSIADKVIQKASQTAQNTLTESKNKIMGSATGIIEPNHAPADLAIAVVGHTNTGKTSLLRTLLRDSKFGEVQNSAATTKHVERISIYDQQTALVDLFDTPGLEDASGLLDWLEDHTNSRADGIEKLHTFLADKVAETDFNQEAKVIRQLLNSDVALYVVDSREPVLSKYKDELTILSWCAKPIMPVFNFIHQVTSEQLQQWQSMLSVRNLHVSTGFDTVAFDFEGELLLWKNLDTLLSNSSISNPKLSATLNKLQTIRTDQWHDLCEQASIAISHTLLSIAAYKKEISEETDPSPVLQEMQEQVRQLERQLHNNLLNIYQFYNSDIAPTELELDNFQRDPFDPELLKTYGIRTTSGAVAGALAGLSIDAATFGASLGLGAAVGGLIGGILSNTESITDKITGKKSLYIDPETITLIATRAKDLLEVLLHRGHADQSKITIYKNTQNTNLADAKQPELQTVWQTNKLPKPLKKARTKPSWCELNTNNPNQSHTLREESLVDLTPYFMLTEQQ